MASPNPRKNPMVRAMTIFGGMIPLFSVDLMEASLGKEMKIVEKAARLIMTAIKTTLGREMLNTLEPRIPNTKPPENY